MEGRHRKEKEKQIKGDLIIKHRFPLWSDANINGKANSERGPKEKTFYVLLSEI